MSVKKQFLIIGYILLIAVDRVVVAFLYDWHFIIKGLAFLLLYNLLLPISSVKLKGCITVYLVLGIGIFSYSYWRIESDTFLFFINVARLIEVFFALATIQILQTKVNFKFNTEWRSLAIIILIAFAFMASVFDFFAGGIQLVILLRMTQVGLLASYVFFRKALHWTLSLWVILMVGADFLAGLRISEILPSSAIHIQHSLQYLSFLLMVLGVMLTLAKTTPQSSSSRRLVAN